jgi:hypothetical protein
MWEKGKAISAVFRGVKTAISFGDFRGVNSPAIASPFMISRIMAFKPSALPSRYALENFWKAK